MFTVNDNVTNVIVAAESTSNCKISPWFRVVVQPVRVVSSDLLLAVIVGGAAAVIESAPVGG